MCWGAFYALWMEKTPICAGAPSALDGRGGEAHGWCALGALRAGRGGIGLVRLRRSNGRGDTTQTASSLSGHPDTQICWCAFDALRVKEDR